MIAPPAEPVCAGPVADWATRRSVLLPAKAPGHTTPAAPEQSKEIFGARLTIGSGVNRILVRNLFAIRKVRSWFVIESASPKAAPGALRLG